MGVLQDMAIVANGCKHTAAVMKSLKYATIFLTIFNDSTSLSALFVRSKHNSVNLCKNAISDI